MRYLQPSFSTYAPGDKEYRDNWDAVFGGKKSIVSSATTLQEQVREFHAVYKQPIAEKPTLLPQARRLLRLDLIREEFHELEDAVFDDNLVEIADALGDLLYVVEGMAIEYGIDTKAVLAEIHRSNLTKLGEDGKPIYNEHGKVVKGPNYEPPNLRKVLGL